MRTHNKFAPSTVNVYSLWESCPGQTNKKKDLLLPESHAEGYHKIPAPRSLPTYPYAVEAHVDGARGEGNSFQYAS